MALGVVVDRRSDNAPGSSEVLEAGSSGRYEVDLTVRCEHADLHAAEAFQVPYRLFSFDHETSIEHETVLCAAACVEDRPGSLNHEFRGDEYTFLRVDLHCSRTRCGHHHRIQHRQLTPRLADRTQISKRGREAKASWRCLVGESPSSKRNSNGSGTPCYQSDSQTGLGTSGGSSWMRGGKPDRR